jgi:hypothetical protein
MPACAVAFFIFSVCDEVISGQVVKAGDCAKKRWLLPKKSFNLQIPSSP